MWYPLSTKPPPNVTLLMTNIKEPGYFAFMNTGTFPWDPLARWPLAVWGKGAALVWTCVILFDIAQ